MICEDPNVRSDAPTEEYLHFLRTAPKIRGVPPGTVIVTGRLECYRDITEKWLKENNVNYSKLIMKPDYLRGVGNTPKFKADNYIPEAILFIESCPQQARAIADISGRPVFCARDLKIYGNRVG